MSVKFDSFLCAICLEPYSQKGIVTSECNHTFHINCYLQLQDKPCPLCRENMRNVSAADVTYNIPSNSRPTQSGSIEWRNSAGQLHRSGDLPAIIWASGTQYWYKIKKMELKTIMNEIERKTLEDENIKEFTHEFFIHSSKEWRKNKKKIGLSYIYTCDYIDPYGTKCTRQYEHYHGNFNI